VVGQCYRVTNTNPNELDGACTVSYTSYETNTVEYADVFPGVTIYLCAKLGGPPNPFAGVCGFTDVQSCLQNCTTNSICDGC
jgi:hypothetical protein